MSNPISEFYVLEKLSLRIAKGPDAPKRGDAVIATSRFSHVNEFEIGDRRFVRSTCTAGKIDLVKETSRTGGVFMCRFRKPK